MVTLTTFDPFVRFGWVTAFWSGIAIGFLMGVGLMLVVR